MDSALLAIILLLRLGSPDCWLVVVLSQNENRHGRWDALQFFLKQNAILSCSQIFSIVTTKQLSLVSSFQAILVKIITAEGQRGVTFCKTYRGTTSLLHSPCDIFCPSSETSAGMDGPNLFRCCLYRHCGFNMSLFTPCFCPILNYAFKREVCLKHYISLF
jgi:hypothetical protein